MSTGSPPPKVAVLGLGAMGYAMAKTLVKKGFSVAGFDVSPDAMQRFGDAGGLTAETPKDAAKSADIVIVMVSNSKQVTSVLLDQDGAIHGLKQNATIILSSTVTPDYYSYIQSHIAEDFQRLDVKILDCPVSGGVAGAENGTLSIFSSGSDEALEIASPVLQALATKSEKVYKIPGGLGSGSKAKMCHQVLPEIDIALCAEAMALAARAGLNTREIYDAVQASDGRSWIFGDRVVHMIENDQLAYSVIPNSYKDSSIIMQTAAEIQIPMPLVSTALQVYQAGIHAGWAQQDDSRLWQLYLREYGDDAIFQQTLSSPPIPKKDNFDHQDIIDISAGVHLAASVEATRFVRAVGLDADVMYEIISNAAGSNAQFIQAVPQMKKDAPSFKNVDGSRDVCERLRNVINKANSIGAPLPMASAALQSFLIDFATPSREGYD